MHALDPDTVVAVTAALDGCYYALLEHSLTCGWTASSVPAPHLWFPAMTAAHPGASSLRKTPAHILLGIVERSLRTGKSAARMLICTVAMTMRQTTDNTVGSGLVRKL